METEIRSILEQYGPQTGAELVERSRGDVFSLWHACRKSPLCRLERVGSRYLRLDRAVQGYARLSPSIRREFLTYTLVGLQGQDAELIQRAAALGSEIRRISRTKLQLARESLESVFASLPDQVGIREQTCVIIAGDIVYEMAHTVPRPEKSTGKMVRGSDLDLIVVTADDFPPECVQSLDRAIYRKKHYLLVHPDYREEVDYLIKNVSRVREQLAFDTFEYMVASKILDEGELLSGSPALFQTVKDLLDEHGIPAKLESLEAQAACSRELAEARLLDLSAELTAEESYHLFYTREEGEEIY